MRYINFSPIKLLNNLYGKIHKKFDIPSVKSLQIFIGHMEGQI